MLILTRSRDERIVIGDDIVIQVIDFRGDKVRLGITAPAEVSINRQEIHERILCERRSAGQKLSPGLNAGSGLKQK